MELNNFSFQKLKLLQLSIINLVFKEDETHLMELKNQGLIINKNLRQIAKIHLDFRARRVEASIDNIYSLK